MADLTNIGCCGCFNFLSKPSVPARQPLDADGMLYEDLLENQSAQDPDGSFYTGHDPHLSFYNANNLDTSFLNEDGPDKSFYDRDADDYLDESDSGPPMKSSEDIIQSRAQSGFACRDIPVKETNKLFRTQVLYRNVKDEKLYAVKVLNKPYMLKVHVVRSETAMTDVLRENVIHGDIKPDNLLVTSSGNVKIGDFSVSQVFEDDDDMLWRSPGTPVFTAPECCQGSAYHGRASDTWAVGVTLYCMISGHYPFLGDTLQETYDKITNDPVQIPDDMNPQLADLLQRLLCKDPEERITLQTAAEHPWVAGDKGPVPEHICRCGFGRWKRSDLGNQVQ